LEIRRFPVLSSAIAAAALVVVWQWATVTANYGGSWTALFCTGALQPPAPELSFEHIYRFKDSAGYDGQFYHYIAHDPLLRTHLMAAIDDPGYRCRRIFVPALAYGLALGRPQWIDRAYEAAWLLAVAMGVYWSCRCAQEAGLGPYWGLFFLFIPAVPVTTDRMVVDGALAALTAAFLYYCRKPSWRLFVVLCCAALTRETGFLLIAAYCGWQVWRGQWRVGGVFALTAAPAFAWFAYVRTRTAPSPLRVSIEPLAQLIGAFRHPILYPVGTPLVTWVRVADVTALAGMTLAFVLALWWVARRKVSDEPGPARWAALLFALLGLLLLEPPIFSSAYDMGRYFSPLLMFLAAAAAASRRPALLLPTAMILPRIAIQFAPQVLGIGRWLSR
jgi:hypothetical protein